MELKVKPTTIRVGRARIEISVTERGRYVDAEVRIFGCGIDETFALSGRAVVDIYTKVSGVLMITATNPSYNPATAIVTVVRTSFDNFCRECLSDSEVICDWDTLHGYLVDNTVANNWWKLTKEQRIAIVNKILSVLFPDYIRRYCYGKDNCEGGEGNYYEAVCLDNAAMRAVCLGGAVTNDQKVYYNNEVCCPKHDNDVCFGLEHYNLPAYTVTSQTEYGWHAMAAIQVGADPDDHTSWKIFQYGYFDIKPGDWQMPYFEPISEITISELKELCPGEFDELGATEEAYKRFVFEPDGDLRLPKKIRLHLKILPVPKQVKMFSTVNNEVVVENQSEFDVDILDGLIYITIFFDDHIWTRGLWVSSTAIGENVEEGRVVYGDTVEFTKDNDEHTHGDDRIIISVHEIESHDTILSISITDINGNPISEAYVGDTVYITGILIDYETRDLLQNAEITLYRNSTKTNLTDMTNENGEYSIPYTVVDADYPSVKFKTKFGGSGV